MDTEAARAQSFVREPGAGSTISFLGVTHIYKATAAETGGSFSLWEAVFPPGTGAPPHTHMREDEAFTVLEGELTFEFEGGAAPHRVGPGGFFFGARGRRHAVRNNGEKPARALILSAPSVGLDQMFAEFEAAGVQGKPDFAKLISIAARYGVTVEPPSS